MSADLGNLRRKPFMMRRTDRNTFRFPFYDGLIVLGICLVAWTLWGVQSRASTAERKAVVAEKKSEVEAVKTAKLEADARVLPVKAEIKTIQKTQAVAVKEVKIVQSDTAKIKAESADLKKRFKHVQAELDMCRTSNAEKQKQIDTIRMRQYERFMELRANHYRNQERIGRIEKLLGLATRKE